MTLREAVHAVNVMTYDEVRQARAAGSLSIDRMLRKVAGWRRHEPEAWREIRDHVCGPRDYDQHGHGVYRQFGKPKATIVEVRARALKDHEAA